MRELSDGEAATVSLLLGSGLESQAFALRRAALSRSTFSVARRRAWEEGWIWERVVPSAALGVHRMVLALARPFADSAPGVAAAWAELPSAVYLASGVDTLFGVYLTEDAVSAGKLVDYLKETAGLQGISTWSVEPTPTSVPVYFDFEGVWGHVSGRAPLRYPRGFPPGPRTGGSDPPSPGLLELAGEIARRPLREPETGTDGQKFGPGALPRSGKRLLQKGYLDWRMFPDFARLPSYKGIRLSRMALLHGDLKGREGAPVLFEELVGSCRVFPFLYVVEGDRVFLGAMGRGSPPEGAEVEERSPVLPTIQRHLANVGVVHIEMGAARTLLEHRYDRLFPPPG